jgi:hypothetical protein
MICVNAGNAGALVAKSRLLRQSISAWAVEIEKYRWYAIIDFIFNLYTCRD